MSDLRALLALLQAPGLGPRRLQKLLDQCEDDAEAALRAGESIWRSVGLGDQAIAALRNPDWDRVDATLRWAEHERTWILTQNETAYPPRLAAISAAPPLLFGVGNVALLSEPQIAIVGTRNPSPDGMQTTRAFAAHLASMGLVITSGLALGIDTAAHTGALEQGRTLAVLGNGPDQIYPPANRGLARQIIEQDGALISEYPPGVGPHGTHFPRRNRIISGLSYGTLVTEATQRSGSLITARYAAEQGREVFAIPGSIHNPLARGCHALIREGAKLIDSVDQLLEELVPQLQAFMREPPAPRPTASATPAPVVDDLDAEHQQILTTLGQEHLAADEIIARSGLPARDVASMLLLLELQGHVSSHPGGRYSRCFNTR